MQVNCEGRDGFNFYDDCDVSGLQKVPIDRQLTGGGSRMIREYFQVTRWACSRKSFTVRIAHSEFLRGPQATFQDIATLLHIKG